MSGELRRASLEDAAVVAGLFNEYRQFYGQASDIDLANKFINARLARKDAVIFLMLDAQGNGLGFCQLYPSFSSIHARANLILSDLYVTQHARCVGVGRRLMTTAIDYAKAKGIASIFLETHKDNHQAQALYESLGFQLEQEFLGYNLDIQ
ncbi:GNAT family N-acetyltransferase [Shewanella loihica]|uniref:GCN5-related N-acetyltransferase n=1 Tax=Shewanella loihica (strain ATCC BAA-1088 / PV-4) TaxID=323850 RepID=A3QDR4_SHELP|nr:MULTISPECIES: GNAT family N-acetyltransferase [Shewanella]ABO23612.1 GCN5-related N-acetyltransferase [Shewanella loihica PV-4]QYJ84079.1 GNAT family N-acetyltransferase [Shewanella aegiceratis]QYJ95478.1 GNAT family N-acetyltransferase [Shewanella spartinae]QYJ99284.1 GNAT family N-acetyltransferase [Shewanella alkalitolerans]QYK14592.1 GNAT family N-acetyltransferase [Shewanella rhizosphaerae]